MNNLDGLKASALTVRALSMDIIQDNESGVTKSWEDLATCCSPLFCIDRFGISRPGDNIANEIGQTPAKLVGII